MCDSSCVALTPEQKKQDDRGIFLLLVFLAVIVGVAFIGAYSIAEAKIARMDAICHDYEMVIADLMLNEESVRDVGYEMPKMPYFCPVIK